MSRGLRFSITASDRSRSAFSSVQNNIKKTQGLQRSWNAGLNANRRAVQQFGFQMSDFAIQVAGGQSAMLAFSQQGGQMLQFFGPAGAIAAAFLAVFGSLAIAFQRSGKELSDLTPILGVLGDDFAAIGRVLTQVKELMIDFANLVVNNMDRIIITATLLVGIMAGRWVVAFVRARLATFTLVGALTALRGALIRTGIGALIVGAGELVYQFIRLVRGAGGFGNVMEILGNVAKEVWERMGEAAEIMQLRSSASFNRMKGVLYQNIQGMMDNVEWFVNRAIGAHVGFANAVRAAVGVLPAVFRHMAAQAMNGMIDKIETGLAGIVNAFNTILPEGMQISAPDLSEWRSGVTGEAPSIGEAAANAFNEGFGRMYVGDGVAGGPLGDLGKILEKSAKTTDRLADAMSERLGRPIQSLQELRDALRAADEAGSDIDIRDWFTGDGAGAGRSISDELSDEAKRIKDVFDDMSKSISGALSTAFKGLLDRTKSVKDVAINLFTSILDKLTETMLNPLWEQIGNQLSTSLIGTPGSTGFSGGLLSGIFTGLFGSFAGGGSTGKGARAGGLDGRGGRLAMVHPNETIYDHTRHQGPEQGGTNLEVHIHENASEGQTRVQQSGGRIDVFLRKMVNETIAEGGADRAMRGRYGLQPQAAGR